MSVTADALTIMFFFFNDTATTEIYTLSLHDALPISSRNIIKHGKRRRICKDCGRTFSLEKNITKKLRKAAEQWILDRSTLRRIEVRTGLDFTAKLRLAQQYAKHVPSPLENLIKNLHKASGILMLDATFTKIKGKDLAIIIAYDTGIGVVDYWFDVTENATAYNYILQRLKEVGYMLICLVSDGNGSIATVARERNLPQQRCLFHLLKNLRRSLTNEMSWKKPKDHILYSRIKGILKTNNLEDLSERINKFREFERIFPGRREVFKWLWAVLPNAVLHLSYEENVPRTTALLENLNGQIKARLKTFRGVKSEQSLHNLLKILFHFNNYKF